MSDKDLRGSCAPSDAVIRSVVPKIDLRLGTVICWGEFREILKMNHFLLARFILLESNLSCLGVASVTPRTDSRDKSQRATEKPEKCISFTFMDQPVKVFVYETL